VKNSCGESGKIGMAVPFGNPSMTSRVIHYQMVSDCEYLRMPFGPHRLQLPHYTGKLFLSKYFTSGMKEEDGQDNYRKQNKSKIRIQIQK
jgi:hypothetical protein